MLHAVRCCRHYAVLRCSTHLHAVERICALLHPVVLVNSLAMQKAAGLCVPEKNRQITPCIMTENLMRRGRAVLKRSNELLRRRVLLLRSRTRYTLTSYLEFYTRALSLSLPLSLTISSSISLILTQTHTHMLEHINT